MRHAVKHWPIKKMKARDLAILLVRIFALWFVLRSVMFLEQVPIAFFNPISSYDTFTRYHSFLNAFNFVCCLALGVILLYKTDIVADFVVKRTSREEAPGASASELAIQIKAQQDTVTGMLRLQMSLS